MATAATPTMNGIYNQVPVGLDEVDVIVAGGGTTGSVVAARLSDADPNLSVLVVERGQNSLGDPMVTNPLCFVGNIVPLPEGNPRLMYYQGQNEPQIADRAVVVPAASVLGGGSSVNMATYTRAQREELDAWNVPGWTADELLPYMKKLETYHGPGSADTHGKDGPIQISKGSFGPTQLQGQFIKAAAEVGIPEAVDLQNLDSNQAVQRNLCYISPDGIRSDAAHAYLEPRLRDGNNPNLHVLVEHEVVRVLFAGDKGAKKAVGVQVRGTPGYQGGTGTQAQVREIRAKKMVVVSAGALGSPLLLERSGVGDKDVLGRAGVEVVAESPGVGAEFQDHYTMMVSYHASLSRDETVDDVLKGETTLPEMVRQKSPMLGWNASEVTSKVRPTDGEIEAGGLGDRARKVWDRDFKDAPNKPVAIIAMANGFIARIPEEYKDEQFLSVGPFLLHPYGRGHVHVGGPAIEDEIDLRTGILSDEDGFDLAMAKWLYKKQREIVRRLDVYRGEFPALHPPFDEASDAVCKKRDGPLGPGVRDIAYTEADDEVLVKWIKENISQNWHGIGTCRMGPRDKGAVVDRHLGVHGVGALKVADLSVMPLNVGANTANMAFTIGEKAGDIFAAELLSSGQLDK